MHCTPCSSSPNTGATQHLPEVALHITTAIATIVLIGGILSMMALKGVPLAGINSLANNLGEIFAYGTLIGGGVLLTATFALSEIFYRGLQNKQLSQREIEDLPIGQWYHGEDIHAKLAEGQYWKISNIHGFACTQGLYVFRNATDCTNMLEELGLRNGEQLFNANEFEYPSYYAENICQEGQYQAMHEWLETPLESGAYLEFTIEGNQTTIYGLRVREEDREQTFFFRTEESRREQRSGLVDQEMLENRDFFRQIAKERGLSLEQMLVKSNLLLPGEYWSFNPGPEDSDDFYVVLLYGGRNNLNDFYFANNEDARQFKEGFEKAKDRYETVRDLAIRMSVAVNEHNQTAKIHSIVTTYEECGLALGITIDPVKGHRPRLISIDDIDQYVQDHGGVDPTEQFLALQTIKDKEKNCLRQKDQVIIDSWHQRLQPKQYHIENQPESRYCLVIWKDKNTGHDYFRTEGQALQFIASKLKKYKQITP